MPLIVEDVAKRYGRTPALRGVGLDVADGEFLALLGPSGSGKTTLLRILAGLDRPERGRVTYGGEDLLALGPRERRAGMVFQHYALFRHMTVAANIAFGLKARRRADRPAPAEIARRVEELLGLVQLEGYGPRYPGQLSGGQQQRVALARALAIEPRLLLLDEPFGALDAKVRRELRRWLRRLHDETGVTTIFVTHDQEEALDLADRVAILSDGAVAQIGAPAEVYAAPANAFVYEFLGAANRLEGEVRGGELHVAGAVLPAPEGAPQGPVAVLFRPQDTTIAAPGEAGLSARVLAAAPRPGAVRLDCAVAGAVVEVELTGEAAPVKGAEITLALPRMALFAR